MKKEIKQITSKTRQALYEAMWSENDFVELLPIRKAPYQNRFSRNSYVFDMKGDRSEEKRDGLKEIFRIANKELFDEKFEEACDGSANESNRITTLHSSSLCALLFFYNVTEANPLVMELNGTETVFTESVFEFQNTVIPGCNPSNMDVVLLGKQGNTKIVLFLESKFSEYYQGVGQSLDISKAYLGKEIVSSTIYNSDEFISLLELNKSEAKSSDNFRIEANETMYIEGIKQMISHYVGVHNFIRRKSEVPENARQKKVNEYFDSDTKVYLGAMLFDEHIGDLLIGREKINCLKAYENKYNVLASIINNKTDLQGRFEMLTEIQKYSLFKDNEHSLEENIRRFYFG